MDEPFILAFQPASLDFDDSEIIRFKRAFPIQSTNESGLRRLSRAGNEAPRENLGQGNAFDKTTTGT